MTHTPITVVAATNRKKSLSGQVAQHYASRLQQQGGKSRLLLLEDLPTDFIASALYENMGQNAVFNQFKQVMEETQKYVFVVPEYNGSFPGIFKAFIDALKFPDTFRNKKCALVGVSKGPQGGAFAMSHLTDIFHYLGMQVLARKVRLSSIHDSQLATVLAKPDYVDQLERQAAEIMAF